MTSDAAPGERGNAPPEKLSIVVYSGAFDRVHYALATAAAAAAVDTPVTLFFTMWALPALKRGASSGAPGWAELALSEGAERALAYDVRLGERGVARFEELVEACRSLGVNFMVCEMGLRAMGLKEGELREDLEFQSGGIVTFLKDASAKGAMLFV